MTVTDISALRNEVWAALGTVIDPELDEPITDLGFVRSHRLTGPDVEVHLRLPTSFCAPNFAYLMCADAQEALLAVPGIGKVMVVLDDHHDSDKINNGLAAMAGYKGTFGAEAQDDLEELRNLFQRKAYVAAMERACTTVLSTTSRQAEDLFDITLADLPEGKETTSLLERRRAIGLRTDGGAPLFVDEDGRVIERDKIPLKLRFAKTVRVSVDGNAHFCRGLLRTRYPGSDDDQTPRRHGGEADGPVTAGRRRTDI